MFGTKEFEDGQFCPLIADKCAKHKCAWYTCVKGTDPQSGQPIDRWGCAVAWLPVLTIENSNQQRQTAATVDKVVNQLHRSRSEFIGALSDEARERIFRDGVKLIQE